MQAVFNLTCYWLKNEIDLFTLEGFRLKMEEVSSDSVYGDKKIKQKRKRSTKQLYYLLKCLGERMLCPSETWLIG